MHKICTVNIIHLHCKCATIEMKQQTKKEWITSILRGRKSTTITAIAFNKSKYKGVQMLYSDFSLYAIWVKVWQENKKILLSAVQSVRHREHIEWVHALFWFPRFTHKKNTGSVFLFFFAFLWALKLFTKHSELGKLKATQYRCNKCHQNRIVSFFSETKNVSHMKANFASRR